jgi:hypothetical protein
VDEKVRDVIREHSADAIGLPITVMASRMFEEHGLKVSTLPDKTLRAYLTNRPALYSLDPKDPSAKVRCKPEACTRSTT